MTNLQTTLDLNDPADPETGFDSYIKVRKVWNQLNFGWSKCLFQTIFLPGEYTASSKYNDIALFELETPVNFTLELCKSIKPACLYSPPDNSTEDNEFKIIGFGNKNIRKSKSLQIWVNCNFNNLIILREKIKLAAESKRLRNHVGFMQEDV